ncbi:MAG: DUF4097 family beta strand repeat-containing protein [Planctomycetota bacterium]
MHPPKGPLFAALTAAVCLGLQGCTGGDAFRPIGSTTGRLAPAAAFEALVLDLEVATVRLREGDGADLEVRADVSVKDTFAGSVAAAADGALPFGEWIDLQQQGGRVVLRSARRGADHELRLEIVVPRGAHALDAHVVVGSLDLAVTEAPQLDLDLSVGTLRARVDRVSGALTARVATGTIDVVVDAAVGGDVSAIVGVGDVTLDLPDDAEGRFELSAAVGSVRGAAAWGLAERSTLTGASAEGRRGAAERRVRAVSSTGTVTLR